MPWSSILRSIFGGVSAGARTGAITNAIRAGVPTATVARTGTTLIPRVSPLSPQLVRMADNIPQIATGRVPIAQIAAAPPRLFAMPTATAARVPFAMPSARVAGAVGPSPARLAISATENPQTLSIIRALQGAASRVIPMGGRVAAPTMPRAIGAAPRVATPGVSRPYVRPEARTFAAGGRTQAGPPLTGARGTQAGPPLFDTAAAPSAAQAAAPSAGRDIIGAAFGVGKKGQFLRELPFTLAPAAGVIAEGAGIDVPEPLQTALEILSLGAGLRGGGRQLIKGVRGRRAGEGGLGNILGGLTGVGLSTYLTPLNPGSPLFEGEDVTVAAAATPETIESVSIPEGGVTGPGGGAPQPGTPEDDAQTQLEAIDEAFQAAVDELTAAYGGAAEALRALESGDPYLAQALASLDAQYRQAQTAVAAEYSAAVGDIAGYQQQVDALMQEVAAEQAADFEAAAGGLEGMNVGVDPATAALAEEAGVSDTAVGGGAVTGAGLARGLAGAASAAGAAERIRTGSELAGIVAAARQEAAAQQAALTQNYLGQRYQTEVEAAQAEAARRQAIQDALVQNELELGQALAGIQQQRAQQLGALSPQDYAGAAGTSAAMTNPAWFGGRLEGDSNAPVAGLKKVIQDPVDKTPQEVDATVSDVNMLVDQLSAAASVARQKYTQNSPADAYAHLADFYNRVPNPSWLSALGVPTTAYEAYTDLFGQAPF